MSKCFNIGFPRPIPDSGGVTITATKDVFTIDTGQTVKMGDKLYWYNKAGVPTVKQPTDTRFQTGSRYAIYTSIGTYESALCAVGPNTFVVGLTTYGVTLKVGKINADSTITFGTGLVISSQQSQVNKKLFRLTDTTFLLYYKGVDNNCYLTVGSIATDLTITMGTTVSAAYSPAGGTCDVLSATRVIVVSAYVGAGIIQTYSISGTTLSPEYSASCGSGTNVGALAICGMNATRFMVSWSDSPGSAVMQVNIGNITSNISMGTPVNATTQSTSTSAALYKVDDNKVIMAYTIDGSGIVATQLDTIIGTTSPTRINKPISIGTSISYLNTNKGKSFVLSDGYLYSVEAIGYYDTQSFPLCLVRYKIGTDNLISIQDYTPVDNFSSYVGFLASYDSSNIIVAGYDPSTGVDYIKIINSYSIVNCISLSGGVAGQQIKCKYW